MIRLPGLVEDERPRARRLLTVVLGGFLALAGCTGSVAIPSSRGPLPRDSPVPPDEIALESQIHDLVNRHRTSRGLPSLRREPRIDEIAREHSRAMASRRRPFGHDGFEARTSAISAVMAMRSMAENVAYDGRSGPDLAGLVVQGWIASSGHRQNIEGDFTHTGIGVGRGSDGVFYVTQIFVRAD